MAQKDDDKGKKKVVPPAKNKLGGTSNQPAKQSPAAKVDAGMSTAGTDSTAGTGTTTVTDAASAIKADLKKATGQTLNKVTNKVTQFLKPAGKEVKEMFNLKKPFDPLPLVEPASIFVRLPNPGTMDQSFTINITNKGTTRMLFKIRGTKQSHFRVELTYGFMEPGEHKSIRVQPNAIKQYNDQEFTREDRFTVLMAPVPSGRDNETNARSLWSCKPQPEKAFSVYIFWLKEAAVAVGQEPAKKAEPVCKKPVKKEKDVALPEEGPHTDAFYEHLADDELEGDMDMKPSALVFMTPCEGTDEDIKTVYVRNPTADRLVYKMKCSQITRFRMYPTMGFLEPKSRSKIEVRPKKFTEDDEAGFVALDHLTLVYAKAPSEEMTAKEVWVKGNPQYPAETQTKELKATIQYARMEEGDEDEEPRVPMKIVKTEKGFTLQPRDPPPAQ